MSDEPLVSVLLCTHDRRQMFQRALACYQSQSYKNKELIVVDDGIDRVSDLLEGVADAIYIYYPAQNLSQKRNVGIRAAHGELIAHQDDDDWSGPERLAIQAEAMQEHRDAMACGFSSVYWYSFVRHEACHCQTEPWGATLMYRREYALAHPWREDITLAEDCYFLEPLRDTSGMLAIPSEEQFVATQHSGNLPRPFGATGWPIVPIAQLPEGFRDSAGL
jgi:glycosyltransferase involved in cell wall biosynthesis